MPSPPLPITGERTVPDVPHENYWFRRHEAVYRYAAGVLGPDRRVLDAGSGEGYGAGLMRGRGHRVTALDYDAVAVRHVRAAYRGVSVVRGNLVALPFSDGSFDAVVSLQTIEHLWDQPGFALECARVVTPDGVVVLSTPNRLTFPPGNVFHSTELGPPELADVLRHTGRPFRLLGLHHGPRILEHEHRHGPVVAAQLGADHEHWPTGLRTFVASVRATDFVLSDEAPEQALDLVAVMVG